MKITHVGLSEEAMPIQYCNHINGDHAVLISPGDPNWGGNMHTSVVESLFFSLDKAGISAARFSFARYQIFNNIYDKYITQTALCLEEFIREVGKDKHFWLIGFSFGALISLNVFLRRPGIIGSIMISPPVLNYDFVSWLSVRSTQGLILYGTKDEITPKHAIDSYIDCLKSRKINMELQTIIGANHSMFHKEDQVNSKIIDYIKNFNLKLIKNF